MNLSSNDQLKTQQVLDIDWADRWLVYHRLRDLAIPCSCETNQPLRVEINSSTTAMQVWSVCQQLKAPRNYLVSWLKRCWQQSS